MFTKANPHRISLTPEMIGRLAEAAGLAPACAFENSDEWHGSLVAQWRRRMRRARLAAVSPSLTSLCLAFCLVVM
jgi:hypothetical protein